MEFLTSSNAIELFFCEWLPVLFILCLFMVSLYSTDQHVAVMCQDMQQCANKGREEEGCEQINMDVNNAGFRILKKNRLCKCFMRKEMHSTRLLDLKNTQNAY